MTRPNSNRLWSEAGSGARRCALNQGMSGAARLDAMHASRRSLFQKRSPWCKLIKTRGLEGGVLWNFHSSFSTQLQVRAFIIGTCGRVSREVDKLVAEKVLSDRYGIKIILANRGSSID